MDISVTQKQEGFWVKMSNRKRDRRNGEKRGVIGLTMAQIHEIF